MKCAPDVKLAIDRSYRSDTVKTRMGFKYNELLYSYTKKTVAAETFYNESKQFNRFTEKIEDS